MPMSRATPPGKAVSRRVLRREFRADDAEEVVRAHDGLGMIDDAREATKGDAQAKEVPSCVRLAGADPLPSQGSRSFRR